MAENETWEQVWGVDEYLCAVYARPITMKALLAGLGYSTAEIDALYTVHLAALAAEVAAGIGAQFEADPDGERLRYVVMRRYGLDGVAPASLQEIGDAFAISRERVRQLTVKALRRRKRAPDIDRLAEILRGAADGWLSGAREQ